MPKEKESKPELPVLTEYEKIKAEFRVDSQKANMRIAQLDRMIPQLEKEREQLVGMLAVMDRVLNPSEEDNGKEGKSDESKGNGNESDGSKERGDGSN